MGYEYSVNGGGFIGCPGDVSGYAYKLLHLWETLPVSGVRPRLYHWHKHFDPYSGSTAVASQYRIEQTSDPSVSPVFILFGHTIGTPVRPPHEGWNALRTWLDRNGWGFISLLGDGPFIEPSSPPEGTIPLTGTMFELFDVLRTTDSTDLRVYDVSGLVSPAADTPEYQTQQAWCRRLIEELGKTYTVRTPKTEEEFNRQVVDDLKDAFDLPLLDPFDDATLPSLDAVGVDEPQLFCRGDLIETLTARILEQGRPFTRIVGVSGTGKSSLLRAGLLSHWYKPSTISPGRRFGATALLMEPDLLGALDPDPLRALGLLLTGEYGEQKTGAAGPYPNAISTALSALPAISGDRAADVRAACAWWQGLSSALEGPFVLILDQAEQVDALAKREASERCLNDSSADPTPFLSPVWRRFIDTITSLSGIADPALNAPPLVAGPARFRVVISVHRESAIDLWVCNPVGLGANPSIVVPPLENWRTVISNTLRTYGLFPEETLLDNLATQARQLTDERQPVRDDGQCVDPVTYDRASVLPLVKVALRHLIVAWRDQLSQRSRQELREGDKILTEETIRNDPGGNALDAYVRDSVETLGNAAMAVWVKALSKGKNVQGLFEGEAFKREVSRRYDHLFMGLVNIRDGTIPVSGRNPAGTVIEARGIVELNHIRRDSMLAREEALLVSALKTHALLVGPDSGHWRLPHRTVMANWSHGKDFLVRHKDRLEAKARLQNVFHARADWSKEDIAPFIDLAFGWIGSDVGEDAELSAYLQEGLTKCFRPDRFAFEADDRLDTLPLRVLASGQVVWAGQMLAQAQRDRSWFKKCGLWMIVAAAFGRTEWLNSILASLSSSVGTSWIGNIFVPKVSKAVNSVDPQTGAFPLLLAAEEGHTDCVQLLLENGAEPNRANKENGAFPLLAVAEDGHTDCLRLLLENGAEPNRADKENGAFPLRQAAQNGHTDCLRLLLANGADPNQVDAKDGDSPLLMAAELGHADCVQLLLANGGDPNQVDAKKGDFPLLLAAQEGHADCVQLLLANGADPNRIKAENGTFPLLLAAELGRTDCVQLLLANGAEPNLVDTKCGTFPLLLAAKLGHADCVQLLLKSGAEPNRANAKSGNFPLLMSAVFGCEGCVRLLLENGAEPDRANIENGGFSLLVVAQEGHTDCVRLLLANGADPNRVNEMNGLFPLLMAAQEGHADCVQLLLKSGAEPNRANAKSGNFPLLMASQKGHTDCVQLLLAHGAEPNQIYANNSTSPLLLAVQLGHADCVQLLLENGAEPNRANKENGVFPLLLAAQEGYTDCVQLLLKNGAEPNQAHSSGAFPLLQAAQNGHTDCVQLLLKGGAEPNRTNVCTGTFPLLMAAEGGHEGCAQLLIANGADPNQVEEINGLFPLLLAAQNGHTNCVQLLLENDAEPNRFHADGGFPLLQAAENGHVDCVQLLLKNGAEPNQRHHQSGMTALLAAWMEKQWTVARLLARQPGTIDALAPDIRADFERWLASPNDAPEPPDDETGQTPVQETRPLSAIALPVHEANHADGGLDPGIWEVLGIPEDAIDRKSLQYERWWLTGRNNAAVRIRFIVPITHLELQVLVFDLQSFHVLRPCVPGFDFDGLARSLKNQGIPLDLRQHTDAYFWASLFVTYQLMATPVLPDVPWPLVPDAALPDNPNPEYYWRRWSCCNAEHGLRTTLPIIYKDMLLRFSVLVPEDGIGVHETGKPEVIMSGLDLPVPRFIKGPDGGPISGLWLVRQVEHDGSN